MHPHKFHTAIQTEQVTSGSYTGLRAKPLVLMNPFHSGDTLQFHVTFIP